MPGRKTACDPPRAAQREWRPEQSWSHLLVDIASAVAARIGVVTRRKVDRSLPMRVFAAAVTSNRGMIRVRIGQRRAILIKPQPRNALSVRQQIRIHCRTVAMPSVGTDVGKGSQLAPAK